MSRRRIVPHCFSVGAVLVTLLFVVSAFSLQPAKAVQQPPIPDQKKSDDLKKSDAPKVGAPLVSPESSKDMRQGSAAAKAPDKVAASGEVEIHFYNGSTVRMVVQSEKLEIATPYGNLSVPVEHIRSIEFGLHFPEGTAAKIEAAVKNLSSTAFKDRDTATKSLVDLGPFSYPAVHDATLSKELEVATRAKEILKKLQAKHDKKDLKIAVEDKVVTPTFTIVGRILTQNIKVKADYFGEARLELAQMRRLRAIGVQGADIEVSVDAAKYANAGQWLDTKYQVDGRTPILITAKGLVDTWPQQPGQYVVGPSGMQAQVGGRVVVMGGIPQQAGGAGFVAGRKVGVINQAHGGMLLGKIGDSGEPFIIGDRFDDTPEAEGTLYLQIGPSPWNCQSSGAYDVKISRKN
jgi:hypothetical protein